MGLDISSSSTGWVLLINNRFYKKEGKYYGLIEPDKNFSLAEKLSFFRLSLVNILENTKPDSVIIEDVFLRLNVGTLKLLSRFSGVAIETVKTILNINPELETVKKVRSQLGTQDKKVVYKLIVDKFKLPWTEKEFNKYNDITDAIALCLFHKEEEKGD